MRIEDERSLANLMTATATQLSHRDASEDASMPRTNGEVSWLRLWEVLGWDEV